MIAAPDLYECGTLSCPDTSWGDPTTTEIRLVRHISPTAEPQSVFVRWFGLEKITIGFLGLCFKIVIVCFCGELF